MSTKLGIVTLLTFLSASSVAAAQGYGQPAQPGQNTDMNSGGLSPPNSGFGNSYSSSTEHELEEADREDSGRGLEFFYINAEIGAQHLGLQTFKANDLVDADVVKTSQTGLLYGGGLGVRLVFLTLGARFRLGTFDEWQLWTLNGELGLRIPLGNLEPYFTFGGGYASMGSFDSGNLGGKLNSDDVDVTGFNLRAGFGFDYYLSPVFSLGANLTGDVLFLTRPGVDPSKLQASGGTTGSAGQAASQVYAADGSSIGAGGTLTAVAGLHF